MKMIDDRKQKPKPKVERRRMESLTGSPTTKRRRPVIQKIRDPKTLKMPVRDDKVEEIKAVWQSPKFKTHNQRLIYLLRHCTIIEPQYGYTIREFAHALHPQKMDTKSMGEYDSKYYAFKALRQMFRRFNHDVTNHEVVLSAVLAKGTGKWYYYNIIYDEQAMKDAKLRNARMCLGYERSIQLNNDIAEHSEEIERDLKAKFDEIKRKAEVYHKEKDKAEPEKRSPSKFNGERDKGQGTLS